MFTRSKSEILAQKTTINLSQLSNRAVMLPTLVEVVLLETARQITTLRCARKLQNRRKTCVQVISLQEKRQISVRPVQLQCFKHPLPTHFLPTRPNLRRSRKRLKKSTFRSKMEQLMAGSRPLQRPRSITRYAKVCWTVVRYRHRQLQQNQSLQSSMARHVLIPQRRSPHLS